MACYCVLFKWQFWTLGESFASQILDVYPNHLKSFGKKEKTKTPFFVERSLSIGVFKKIPR